MEGVLWGYFKTGRFVDCHVSGTGGGGREVWGCHRVVLAANSAYFDAYLSAADAAAGALGTAPTPAPAAVHLPFPPAIVDAFGDVVPYLYDQRIETDIPLARTIPLLVLTCLLEVEPLTERLFSGLKKMCAGGVECAAVLALLASHPVARVEDALCAKAVAGTPGATASPTEGRPTPSQPGGTPVPYQAVAVALNGVRRANEVCGALYDHCVTALVPQLHRLWQEGEMRSLPPGPLLSVLQHPEATQRLGRDETSALVTKYLLCREASSASAVPDHLFSQLCLHVTDVPAVDITSLLKLAVQRNETSLLKRCMSAAVDAQAWESTPGLKTAVLDAFRVGVAPSPTDGMMMMSPPKPAVTDGKSSYTQAGYGRDRTKPGDADGAASLAPSCKRRKVALLTTPLPCPPLGPDDDEDDDAPPQATLAPSCALFGTQQASACGTPRPLEAFPATPGGAKVPASKACASAGRGGDAVPLSSESGGESIDLSRCEAPPPGSATLGQSAAFALDDQEFDDALAKTVESLSQRPAAADDGGGGGAPAQAPHISGVLKRLHGAMVAHRARRKQMCEGVIADVHTALERKAEYTAAHCDELWAGVAAQQDAKQEFFAAAVAGVEDECRAATATAAAVRRSLDGLDERLAATAAECRQLRELLARSHQHSAQQLHAAGASTQHLLGALRDDAEASLSAMGRQLDSVADKNSTALKRLSALLASELALD
eukprot:TRINITY_DN22197_c0_g1_i1.p1 TRINITY_DN22197_c0_g1~~TRINITY_DN22197_c0_g1_i1.p1  ORF type:complete len:717 (+),score=241.65 TRINITY_DN22197_c0_g1_i1:30-2180(+)